MLSFHWRTSLVGTALAASAAFAQGEDPAALTRAAMKGKYAEPICALRSPEDQSRWGKFSDRGYWEGGTLNGVPNLPAGYWVYVAPTWYVFAKAPKLPNERFKYPKRRDAKDPSVGGKYRELLRTIEAREDADTYGHLHEDGYRTRDHYGGQVDLPPAYWVYADGKWYLWAARIDLAAANTLPSCLAATAQRAP